MAKNTLTQILHILKEGIRAGGEAYPRVFPLGLVMFIPTQWLLAVALDLLTGDNVIVLLILSVMLFVILNAGSVLTMILVASHHQQKECTIETAWKVMLSVLPRAMGAGLISGLLFALTFSFSTALGFFVETLCVVYLPTVIFESVSPLQGLTMSVRRVWGAPIPSLVVAGLTWAILMSTPFIMWFSNQLFPGVTFFQQTLVVITDAVLLPFGQGLVIALYFALFSI